MNLKISKLKKKLTIRMRLLLSDSELRFESAIKDGSTYRMYPPSNLSLSFSAFSSFSDLARRVRSGKTRELYAKHSI